MVVEKQSHAGRKAMPVGEKKIGHKVYLTQEDCSGN